MTTLKQHRKNSGLSLREVAELLSTPNNKVGHQKIFMWEKIGMPKSVRLWVKMAKLYNVALSDFPLK